MSFRTKLLINAAKSNVVIDNKTVITSSKGCLSFFDENQNSERPSANNPYPIDFAESRDICNISPVVSVSESVLFDELESETGKTYQELLPVCNEAENLSHAMVCTQEICYESINIQDCSLLNTTSRSVQLQDVPIEDNTVEGVNVSNICTNNAPEPYQSEKCDPIFSAIKACDQEPGASQICIEEISCSQNVTEPSMLPSQNSNTHQQQDVAQSSAEGKEDGIVPKKKRARDAATMIENQRNKHPLLPSCICRKGCIEKIPEDARNNIWNQFWSLDRQRRRDFISRHVERNKTAYKTTPGASRRHNTLIWKLNDHQVCKIFFLHTLGYSNDEAVQSVLKGNFATNNLNPSVSAAPDPRGHHKPSNAFSEEYNNGMKNYIMSYNPVKSHYNLKHAPNRLYLPVGINFSNMYKGFTQYCHENNLKVCSWTHFHNMIKFLNISTAEPTQDICTKCKNHEVTHKMLELPCNCGDCLDLGIHLKNKADSRTDLKSVETKCKDNNEEIVYTVDMQKAICMPILTTKDYFFSRKLVLFNESFVPPGKDQKAICIVWHEGESGRKAHNIASSYIFVLRKYCRDMKHVHFFLDNCNSQNKNKVLFCALVRVINDNMTSIQKITFEYFEPGHTFMAADTVHAAITKKLKSSGDVYDLEDFVDKIKMSRKNTEVDVINHSDMILICDDSKVVYPKGYNINNLKVIEFRRKHLSFFAKNDYRSDFKEIHFLKKKFETQLQMMINENQNDLLKDIPRETEPKGINSRKKEDLMKLCQSLPYSRKQFFENLRVADDAADLCHIIDAEYD